MATTAAGFGDVRAAPRAMSAGTPGVRLRTGLGVALLVTQWAFVAGVAWDVQWHLAVGRDRPFTAPHLLLLAGIAGSGLCALGGVLWYSLAGRGASGRGQGPWCGWGASSAPPWGCTSPGTGPCAPRWPSPSTTPGTACTGSTSPSGPPST